MHEHILPPRTAKASRNEIYEIKLEIKLKILLEIRSGGVGLKRFQFFFSVENIKLFHFVWLCVSASVWFSSHYNDTVHPWLVHFCKYFWPELDLLRRSFFSLGSVCSEFSLLFGANGQSIYAFLAIELRNGNWNESEWLSAAQCTHLRLR